LGTRGVGRDTGLRPCTFAEDRGPYGGPTMWHAIGRVTIQRMGLGHRLTGTSEPRGVPSVREAGV
jgi:hypothetical protein